MGFNCGIVGLPNVGKSTLFNALTETAAAQAANFPFCTIEPNVGRVAVPDDRLDKIAALAGSADVIPTQLEFIDIAGLVKGAADGEGLGNQFLGNIRQVDAILHVLRCFENPDITHVSGSIDPLRDADIIETELILSDLSVLEKHKESAEKKARGQDKDAKALLDTLNELVPFMEDGNPARRFDKMSDPIVKEQIRQLQLITAKPVLYVCNVNEDDAGSGNKWSDKVAEKAKGENAETVVISAEIEEQISQLDSVEEKEMFLSDIGLETTGLNRVIRNGYDLLDLITFFTAGPKETRAWTVKKGSTAPQSAGKIHTDFEKGFIRAETIAYDDYIANNGEQGAKDAGKLRSEGKDYITKDGDIMLFRFNV